MSVHPDKVELSIKDTYDYAHDKLRLHHLAQRISSELDTGCTEHAALNSVRYSRLKRLQSDTCSIDIFYGVKHNAPRYIHNAGRVRITSANKDYAQHEDALLIIHAILTDDEYAYRLACFELACDDRDHYQYATLKPYTQANQHIGETFYQGNAGLKSMRHYIKPMPDGCSVYRNELCLGRQWVSRHGDPDIAELLSDKENIYSSATNLWIPKLNKASRKIPDAERKHSAELIHELATKTKLPVRDVCRQYFELY